MTDVEKAYLQGYNDGFEKVAASPWLPKATNNAIAQAKAAGGAFPRARGLYNAAMNQPLKIREVGDIVTQPASRRIAAGISGIVGAVGDVYSTGKYLALKGKRKLQGR